MRVGLVTTWNTPCGHAEFASNVVESMPDVDFKPITVMTDQGMIEECYDCDVIHIIYGFIPGITPQGIRVLRSRGKKVVLSNQVTRPHGSFDELMSVCNRVIATEPGLEKFTYVPMGIPDNWVANGKPENLVGTVGFPFAWKQIPSLAAAAKEAGMGFLGVLPDYPPVASETKAVRAEIKAIQPEAILFSEWISKEEVKKQLGRCSVHLYAHGTYPYGDTFGVSSACRYGIATGRPCVFNRFEMYRDLFPYENELYFTEDSSVDGLARTLREAVDGVKRPNKLLKDMSWSRCGEMFKKVYKDVLS